LSQRGKTFRKYTPGGKCVKEGRGLKVSRIDAE